MKIGMYYVDKVGGDTIVSDFINKDKSSVNSINLNNNRIDVVGEFKGGEVKISAEYDGASFEIERTENQPLGDSLYYFPQREMFINLKFKVDKYTMQKYHGIGLTLYRRR